MKLGSREHQFGDAVLKEPQGQSGTPGTTARRSQFLLSPVGMLHPASGYGQYNSWVPLTETTM